MSTDPMTGSVGASQPGDTGLDEAVEAAARALGLRPCPSNKMGVGTNWYACTGGDAPTIGHTCSDNQCQNREHSYRSPCPNRWHKLPEAVAAVRADERAKVLREVEADIRNANPKEGEYAPEWHRALRWALRRIRAALTDPGDPS